LKRCCQVV
jgi:hypothetical protein